MKTKYHYSRTTGLHKFDDTKKAPSYMEIHLYDSEDEAMAQFLKRKNNELQVKIDKAERNIRNFKMQMKDNENEFGYLKEKFPEVFV